MHNPVKSAVDLSRIKMLVADELTALDAFIDNNLSSNLPPVSELNRYIINSGGKRLRPLLVLLIAHALNNYHTRHLTLAAIIEFIHTATLLHDDVVDNAELRRGHKTVKHLWGNNLSILVGDFLYSRAFQLIAQVGISDVINLLSDTTNTIAEGEVQQLLNCRQTNISEADYLHVIYCKTAILFETAAKISALAAGADAALTQMSGEFGRNIGFAFQMLDDALDYAGQNKIGKKTGGDLEEGKATAPFIYALTRCSDADARQLKQALSGDEQISFNTVYTIIKTHGGIEHTYAQATMYADKARAALTAMPESDYKQALMQIAAFVATRDH